MNQLIQNRKDLFLELAECDAAIKRKFTALDFKGKLAVFRELGSDFMGTDNYFYHGEVSLYDTFNWERYESKSLDSIYESTSEYYHWTYKDDTMGLDDYLETSADDKPTVFRELLLNCIGTARSDW